MNRFFAILTTLTALTGAAQGENPRTLEAMNIAGKVRTLQTTQWNGYVNSKT